MKVLATLTVIQSISLLLIIGDLFTPGKNANYIKYKHASAEVAMSQSDGAENMSVGKEELHAIINQELERFFRERVDGEMLAKEAEHHIGKTL
ncbi:MAG: hypothetical protein P8Y45_23390 [Exilibacterium sp.]